MRGNKLSREGTNLTTTTQRARELRAPAAILSIPRDTCSDSIVKLFGACLYGGIAQLSRDMLKVGYRTNLPV